MKVKPTTAELQKKVTALEQKAAKLQQNLDQQIQLRSKEMEDCNQRLKREVADCRLAESSLRESERKYRMLVNSANDAIFIAQDGVAKFLNPKAIEMIGYTESELSRIPYLDLIHPDDRELVIDRKSSKKRGNSIPSTYSLRIINARGKEVWVQLNAAPIEWEGKPATINFLRDITEQKSLETQLHHAQKMQALGTLAGGIAHDFNNILSPIIGYAEILQYEVADNALAQKNIREILKASHRAKDLVQQILTICRKSIPEKKPFRIQPVLKETLKLLRASIPSTIEFSIEVSEDCGSIMGDPTQLHRVVMNLCTNAFQAMQETGGTLGVKLSTEKLEKHDIATDLTPGEYLRLDITDTGHGIEKSILERIFDPYFTTKAQGKGTGLGLSVVHGIVMTHGGGITVNSHPGQGTTFTVLFPRIEPIKKEKEADNKLHLQVGEEKILFVDDEEPIVEVGQLMLQNLGYTVTAVTSSTQALETFRASPHDYDLVVTDLTMPQMTGDSLAKKMLEIRDDIPIILCTGYSENMDEGFTHRAGIRRFLKKPISMQELAHTIRTVLNESDSEKLTYAIAQPVKVRPSGERRRHPRYQAAKGAFAVPFQNPAKQGRIIDISKGGMAFRYIHNTLHPYQLTESGLFAIEMTSSDGFTLDAIPCRIVADTQTRCGVQFEKLTEYQDRLLEQFIQKHTSASAG